MQTDATNSQVLLIRADADPRMGTGHVMRCLALAQAWQDAGGRAACLTANRIEGLNARLTAEGLTLVPLSATPGSDADADQTRETATLLGARWVVLDGYHFSGEFQSRVRQDGIRVLAVDDYGHAGSYAADLVLNQNLHGSEELYRNRAEHTELLLGTKFAMLRREFRAFRGWKREVPETARKVLVTLGGSDPDNVTLKVIEALHGVEVPGLEALVAIGGANPRFKELEKAARDGQGSIRLVANVTNMTELMAWADVAIAAGGTTTWERACMGLPSLVMSVADNQTELAATVQIAGIGWNLGRHGDFRVTCLADGLARLATDAVARAEMARRGPELVDSMGAVRVTDRMKATCLRLRPAKHEDCRIIWEWANEPATRAASFSSTDIPWEQHQRWFDEKLHDPRCIFFVAEDPDQTPLGQVRFELQEREAVISVSLAKQYHGLGYGPTIIREAVRQVLADRPVERINAYIRPENIASCRAFAKVGFLPHQRTEVRGSPAVHLVLMKEHVCNGR
jgi:UDP-2,4-diacetamido-2,4,6-trideoxy-beta-L-altropyranose hydrolase